MTKSVLILGVTGMLGHVLYRKFFFDTRYNVSATARSRNNLAQWFDKDHLDHIYDSVDATQFESVMRTLEKVNPDVVINCIGIIKQLPISKKPIPAITINALFPHRLAEACRSIKARMIHISTDCVFSGKKGNYKESDQSDAEDLYGRTKYLGEVEDENCVTIRTSIIGHELQHKLGLIEWFLSQNDKIQGYTQAIFSGFPTNEIAKIISDVVIENEELSGLYQVSSDPISKYDLLNIVAQTYHKEIEIQAYDSFKCDRSLDSKKFRNETGYSPPSWEKLVENMHSEFVNNYQTRS